MSTRIKHVSIIKLWGIKNISSDFDDHVNIFIGRNGSSKTTFLNLIEATLLCDIYTLSEIDFESIEIELEEEDAIIIKVTKAEQEEDSQIEYKFSSGITFSLPCVDPSFRPRYSMRHRERIFKIQEELSKYVNISWLSINRENTEDIERGYRHDTERIRNTVDVKLNELVKKLVLYQLQLELEANKSATKFKEECLSLMLYNKDSDDITQRNLRQIADTDIQSMKKDLFQAFNVLGVVKNKRDQINNHISKIQEVKSKISEKKDLSFEDIFVLSLINRTLSIIEISKIHESQTKEIFAPMMNLWKCLKGFMQDKTFEFNKEKDGDLNIRLTEDRDKPSTIGITSLSSGEKQLFILLVEALLQKRMPHIFIADEPELSLHLAWQRRIIAAILDLNPNAQIIVATHSPEVAADHRRNLINMKEITSYV